MKWVLRNREIRKQSIAMNYKIYLNKLVACHIETCALTNRKLFQAIDISCVRKIKGKTERDRVRNTI
jgi:hypothetical protein